MAEPAAKSRPGANVAEFTVSELSGAIKSALEDRFGYVRVRGEISGFRGPHASGHCYFALKDDKSKIEAVVWRGSYSKLKVKPQEGLEVIAIGRVTTYPGSSKYQIVIDAMEPAGVGALMALLEERKKKLGAEGLFDEGRKRQIPFLPRVVGIVTSPTGAVIRDMLHGFAERFPTRVLVWPVRVQGETSAQEVAAAIRGFNALPADGAIPRPDVLIVARGGGSLEDLWSFNEEIVVRAAAESRIPLISAVGHETDWTLIDLAADARAPTPTKAAEWAVPKHADLIQQTGSLAVRLATSIRRRLDTARTELKAAARGLPRPEDLIGLPRQRFDAVQARLGRALLANTRAHATRQARVAGRLHPRLLTLRIERCHDRLDAMGRRTRDGLSRLTAHRRTRFERAAARHSPTATAERIHRGLERLSVLAGRADRALENRLLAARRRLDGQGQLLSSLGYRNVLRRGFALVRDPDGRALRSVTGVAAGHRLDVELADGRIAATTDGVTAGPPPGGSTADPHLGLQSRPPAPARPRPRDGSPGGNQGSLF